MKNYLKISTLALILFAGSASAQDDPDSTGWEFGADANFYFFPGGERILLPVFRADIDWLHLEARYNYEDLETFSAWVGYNFKGGGEKADYVFTPMIGAATGLTKGVAAGLEFTVTLGKFEIYSESEYLWDASSKEYNFMYTWTDLTFSPRDWWWVGLSAQRTRLYQTELDIQRGLLLGAAAKNWEFTGYVYNVGFAEPFVLLTVSLGF